MGSRRAEKYDRVVNFLLAEVRKRIEILAQDSQRARIGRVQKLLIAIRQRRLIEAVMQGNF
jgi:hypothetical protein